MKSKYDDTVYQILCRAKHNTQTSYFTSRLRAALEMWGKPIRLLALSSTFVNGPADDFTKFFLT